MRHARNKGSILLAVMVVITLAALVGTTVLYRADAQRGSAATAREQAQLRALVWSGVQGAMAELSSQRDAIMQGGAPTLTNSWDLYTGPVHGNVRLAAIGDKGAVTVSENGKLDLNTADSKMIAKLEGVGDSVAAKILSARASGFASPEELGDVEGMSAELLFGPAEAETAAASPGDSDLGRAQGLLGLTTVFSFDPNTCSGNAHPEGQGLDRVNISGGWTDDLKPDLAQRMSDQAETAVETMLKAGVKPAHDSDVVAGLRNGQAAQPLWAEVLDGVTTGDEEFLRGRVDLNTAPTAVLVCVPGIDQAAAEKIVGARERLDAPSRQPITWPLKEGILTEDQFQSAVDWVTTRSMQWRVRVEARLERSEATSPSASSASTKPASSKPSRPASATTPDGSAEQAPGMVWEAVIDLSGTRARLAYLRDVTYLGALQQRARDQEKAVPANASLDSDSPSQPGDANNPPTTQAAANPSSHDLNINQPKIDGSVNLNPFKASADLKMDTDLKMIGDSDPFPPPEAVPAPAAASQIDPSADTTTGDKPPASKDRRIGRWRTPSKE